MKKFIPLSLLALVVAVLIGCGQKPEEKLQKKWTCSDVEFDLTEIKASIDTIQDSLQRSFAEASLKIFDNMRDAMKGSTYEFKEGGKFESHINFMGEEKTETGTWTLIEEGKRLVTKTDGAEKDDTVNVDVLDGKNFQLSIKDGSTSLKIKYESK